MKRHALFFATALALASLGTAGLAAAQSTPVAKAADARSGHGMRGGIERMDADGDGRISRAEFDAARAAREEAIAARIARRTAEGGRALDADGKARDNADGKRTRHGGAHRTGRAGHGDMRRAGMRHAAGQSFDFDAVDANRDGYLVRSEVAAHRERMRDRMREQREQHLAEAFAAADLNGDGRLSRVEVDE